MSIASLVIPVYSFKISASNQPVFLLHPLSLVWNLFSSSLIWEQNPNLLPWLMSHLILRVLKREDPKAWFWKHKVRENGVLGAQEKQEKHKTTRPWIQETQEARNNEKTQSLRSTKTMDTANKSKHPGNKTQADRLQAAIREDQDSGVTCMITSHHTMTWGKTRPHTGGNSKWRWRDDKTGSDQDSSSLKWIYLRENVLMCSTDSKTQFQTRSWDNTVTFLWSKSIWCPDLGAGKFILKKEFFHVCAPPLAPNLAACPPWGCARSLSWDGLVSRWSSAFTSQSLLTRTPAGCRR